MGTSKSRLVMLHNEFEARFQLGRILPPSAFMGLKGLFSPKNPSFVGINDDIERDEQAIDSMLHGWFDLHWPDALDWEV